jgi:SAM-dependent methyltransferase
VFSDLSHTQRCILDFGCGTGGLLARLAAARRLGVEVNEHAAAEARASGLEVFHSLEDVPPRVADVAISHHALEHVEDPIDCLRLLRRTLKAGGHLRLVIPAESPFWRSQRNSGGDPNNHLFTWTPRSATHLVKAAGFSDAVGTVAPTPTGSRAVASLRRWPAVQARAHWVRSWWFERFNVIVNATNRGA